MTEEEKARYLHQQMHEKHKGHDHMHAEMLFILVIVIIGAQFILFEWKRRHYKSYLLVSLFGLWLIPAGLCISSRWYRFVLFWVIFSLLTAIVMRKAYQKPVTGNTPR